MKKITSAVIPGLLLAVTLPVSAAEFLVSEWNQSTLHVWDPDAATETPYHTIRTNDADINVPEGSTYGWYVDHFSDQLGRFVPGSGSGSDAVWGVPYAYPKHVTVFGGAVFVMDRNSAIIRKYDLDGNEVDSLDLNFAQGQGMATDGNVLFASFWDGANSVFMSFDSDLNPLANFANPTGMPAGDTNIVDFAYDPATATFYGLSTDFEGGTNTQTSDVVQFTMGGSVTDTFTLTFPADGIGQYLTEDVIAEGTARFRVTKSFSDGSEDEVEVTLTCNSGLPLEQSFTIAGGDPGGVVFVVTELQGGETYCEVTESGGPDGYTPEFNGGEGCRWEGVVSGLFSCEISNEADPASFTVTKEWLFEGATAEEVLPEAEVGIECSSQILSVDGVPNDEPGDVYTFLIGDGDSVTVTADTSEGPTTCSAWENIYRSDVESSDDCGARQITAGGSSSCTITNTVFFEGIPTLSQYGMALMALLMLGIGFVGLRRFA
jgi:hypothetical protein